MKSVSDYQDLSNMQMDALKEIGNIGAGNAATALAQMINSKIDMSVPEVSILEFDKVPELIGGADIYVVGIYLTVSGSAPATIYYSREQACRLVDMMMGNQSGNTKPQEMGEMEYSYDGVG